MSQKETYIIVILIVLNFNFLFSQNDVLPIDPNVASLFTIDSDKLGEYTGTISNNIPVYTINDLGLQIPISLEYKSGGITVGQDAGEVGLGWILNAGGVITREIRGLDDFTALYPYPQNEIPDVPLRNNYFPASSISYSSLPFLWDVNGVEKSFSGLNQHDFESNFDTEPDIFHFSFGDYSGDFIVKSNGEISLSKQSDLKIEKVLVGNISNWNWEILDPKGYKYVFNKRKYKTILSGNQKTQISSWHLTKIIAPNSEYVEFQYESGSNKIIANPVFSETVKINRGSEETKDNFYEIDRNNSPLTQIDNLNLKNINFKGGRVIFNYSLGREDLKGAQQLKSIVVNNNDEKKITETSFHYSYFIGNKIAAEYAAPKPSYATGNPELRLRLDSVNINERSYQFDYYMSSLLPSKNSFSQDFWGFHNGIKNTHLIPSVVAKNLGISAPSIYSNRTPVEAYAKDYSLKSIKFPTKGYVKFDYELNTYDPTFVHIGYDSPPPAGQTKTVNLSSSTGPNPNSLTFNTGKISSNNQMKVNLSIDIYSGNPHNVKPREAFLKMLDENGNVLHEWDFTYSWPNDYWRQNMDGINSTLTISTTINNIKSLSNYTLLAYFNPSNSTFRNDPASGVANIYVQWEALEDAANSNIGAGLRIKSIQNYNKDGTLAMYKSFKYDTKAGGSSGVLMTYPIYKIQTEPGYDNVLTSYSIIPEYRTLGGLVGYREVTTLVNDVKDNKKKSGKEVRFFYNDGVKILNDAGSFEIVENPKNGLLYAKEIWKSGQSDDVLQEKTFWHYNINGYDADIFTYDKLYTNLNFGYGVHIREKYSSQYNLIGHNLFFYPHFSNYCYLEKMDIVKFFKEGDFKETRSFNYSTLKDNPSLSNITSSSGDVKTVTYAYPDDYNGIENISNLKEKHIISVPVKIETIYNGKIIDGKIIKYSDNGNPVSVYHYEKNNTAPSEHDRDKYILDSYILKRSFDYKENTNNLIEEHSHNDPSVSYLWGYNGQYPIAKIENATIKEIESKIGSISIIDESDFLAINNLRNTLPNAMVTTYEYEPLVGVTKITDARGQEMTYEYDEFNRLKAVLDNELKLLQEYKYNYKKN